MNLGPDQFIACPHCQGLAKHQTMLSGNTFGLRMWTDGKYMAPMSLQNPAVVKCHHCTKFYWLKKAKKIKEKNVPDSYKKTLDCDEFVAMRKEIPEGAEKEKLLSAVQRYMYVDPQKTKKRVVYWIEYIEEPQENDYYNAIQEGLAKNVKQEKLLKIFAWQRRNDAFRENVKIYAWHISNDTFRDEHYKTVKKQNLSGEAKANLESLVNLLNVKIENDRFLKAEVLRQLGRFEEAKEVLSLKKPRKLSHVFKQLHALCDSRDTCLQELNLEE